MAYTIVKSDGTVLTTIADGTINTTSTSVGLPGRNYAGYGQTLDTNFVHQIENFAAANPPANPLRGQLWYDVNNSVLKVCPTDGLSNANAWVTLATSSGTATTTFGSVSVTGNLQANNITAANAITGDTITVRLATVTANANISNAAITSGSVGTLTTQIITTGSNSTAGTITGTWTANGSANSFIINSGNVYVSNVGNVFGIKCDNYMYANGVPFNPTGTYNNGNVFDYLTGSNAIVQFTGNIAPTRVTSTNITTGSNTTTGTLTGTWTANGGASGNGFIITGGNLVTPGIKTDNYYYANGAIISFSGTYSNANVASYLPTYTGNITANIVSATSLSATGNATVGGIKTDNYYYANGVVISFGSTYSNSNVASYLPTFTGTVGATALTTGANTTAGSITGNWTLTAGSRLQSTYADLAERFASDAYYDPGTVVELGGDKEITAVQYDLSEDVFGVISDTAGYLMNAGAGNDHTHPPVAISGRVKVKVKGKVKKGERLVSAGKGMARAARRDEVNAHNVIGRSLDDKTTDGVGTIEAFVKIN